VDVRPLGALGANERNHQIAQWVEFTAWTQFLLYLLDMRHPCLSMHLGIIGLGPPTLKVGHQPCELEGSHLLGEETSTNLEWLPRWTYPPTHISMEPRTIVLMLMCQASYRAHLSGTAIALAL